MMPIVRFFPACLFFLLTASLAQAEITAELFRHHFITTDLPGDSVPGSGTPALADFDNDGDLDFAASDRQKAIYWFENKGADSWVQHKLGEITIGQLGSVVMDVDGDGWVDFVTGGLWYQNPQTPREKEFSRFAYDDTIKREIHDMVMADVDGDGTTDIVATGDVDGCYWYKIPEKPAQDGNWPRTTVTMDVLDDKDDIHGGFSPAGVDDLDNDGDVDVVLPDRWLQNNGDGTEWTPNSLPYGKRGPYGLSCRSWIVDLDGDGDKDIVVTDSDQADCRAAWLESDGKTPPAFTPHFLPLEAPGTRGSFHALAVADFDEDGDLDILTVEQEDTSIFPKDATPRWYIWENNFGEFTERVIFDNRLGGHDVILGDVDGDGDLDICSKVWSNWPDNANKGREHFDFIENRLVPDIHPPVKDNPDTISE